MEEICKQILKDCNKLKEFLLILGGSGKKIKRKLKSSWKKVKMKVERNLWESCKNVFRRKLKEIWKKVERRLKEVEIVERKLIESCKNFLKDCKKLKEFLLTLGGSWKKDRRKLKLSWKKIERMLKES